MAKNFVSLILVLTSVLFTLSADARTRRSKVTDVARNTIDESLVTAPEPNETCFAPDEPCDIKLLKFIQSAKVTLDIAIFDINLDQLVHAVLIQSKKIPVRILVDRREAKGPHSKVSLLLNAGLSVKIGHQRGIMHNKFAIVDGKTIETGSFNYTNGAAFKNNENQVYLNTPEIVERYRKRFEKIWAQADSAD